MHAGVKVVGSVAVGVALLATSAVGPASARTGAREVWAQNYNSGNVPEIAVARAVAVNASGDVYVTGSSLGPNALPDFTTIKWSSTGERLWVRRYDGPAHDWDAATSLALDGSGNVYVTGESFGSASDFVTIKYSPSGAQQWVVRYEGPGQGDDAPTSLAVRSGDVYVTGRSIGDGTSDDYATIKYSTSGVQEWVARYNGTHNTKDVASDVAVDASGNVYVTGSSGDGSQNLSDYVTVKYDAAGVRQWVARYSLSYDYATALAVDTSGAVYVTGSSFGEGTFYDYATVKYDRTGAEQWVSRYDGGVGDDLAHALAVDATGNVFVTGESVGEGTGADYATIQYTSRGRQKWVARYDGMGHGNDKAMALALSGPGDVVVAGEAWGSGTVFDFATIQYSHQGIEQWVARFNGPNDKYDHATSVAVDSAGDVVVAGWSEAFDGTGSSTTVKFAPI